MSRHDAISQRSESSLLPTNIGEDEPVFAEPWQAQVLALANNLVANGKISASQWSETLGEELRHAKNDGLPDNQETFYNAALRSLEKLSESHVGISNSEFNAKIEAWRTAYLATPHGNPVELPASKQSM